MTRRTNNTMSQRANKANNELSNLLTPGNKTWHFESVPLDEMFEACQNQGLVPLQEDNTEWSGFIVGREGSTAIPLGEVESKVPNNYGPTYTPSSRMLSLSWYKMHRTGLWEVVAYVT